MIMYIKNKLFRLKIYLRYYFCDSYVHYKDKESPIHSWFSLSKSKYLVIPRTLLQSMPLDWQKEFVLLLEKGEEITRNLDIPEEWTDDYNVKMFNKDGRITSDPLADYKKGSRILTFKKDGHK